MISEVPVNESEVLDVSEPADPKDRVAPAEPLELRGPDQALEPPPPPEPPQREPKRKPGRPKKDRNEDRNEDRNDRVARVARVAPAELAAPAPKAKPKAKKQPAADPVDRIAAADPIQFSINDLSSAQLVAELVNRRRATEREMKANLYRSFVM